MVHRSGQIAALGLLAALTLAGCGASALAQSSPPTPTVIPLPTDGPAPAVSAVGEIKAVRDIDLIFTVQGVVADVKVKEGDTVKKGDLLAILDTRPFDQRVDQAAAALTIAQAQESALTDEPRTADIAGAEAQVRQAQVAVGQARITQTQDVKTGAAALTAAQANLQATRDRLSAAKTQADTAIAQTAEALTQAQARYAQAKHNWEYIQETGKDPNVGKGVYYVPDGNPNNPAHFQPVAKRPDATDGAQENYYSQYVQAEAAMHQAEEQVQQAQVAADAAHQAEITGDQGAEQQVTQAQAALDRLSLPSNIDRVAAAQAALNQAAAGRARLNPDPRPSQQEQAKGNIALAQAALNQAKLNREYAELRAPFDATVTVVNIDPGDAAGVATGKPAVQLADFSALRFEVQINDADIGRVHLGQTVQIRLDSQPDQPISATVSYIAPSATIAGTTRSYLVRVALAQPDGLRAGMSGQIDFLK